MSASILRYKDTRTREKLDIDRENLWLHFVVRPLSVYPTRLFLALGVSPNQTTFIGIVISIAGCCLLAFGDYWMVLIGAIIINIGFLVDVIDGNIARHKRQATKYGGYIDNLADRLVAGIVPIALSTGLYATLGNALYLVLGMGWAFFITFKCLITESYRVSFGEKARRFYKAETKSLIYRAGIAIETSMIPLLLISAIVDIAWLFMIIWTAITGFEMIFVGILTLIKTPRNNI